MSSASIGRSKNRLHYVRDRSFREGFSGMRRAVMCVTDCRTSRDDGVMSRSKANASDGGQGSFFSTLAPSTSASSRSFARVRLAVEPGRTRCGAPVERAEREAIVPASSVVGVCGCATYRGYSRTARAAAPSLPACLCRPRREVGRPSVGRRTRASAGSYDAERRPMLLLRPLIDTTTPPWWQRRACGKRDRPAVRYNLLK